MANQIGNYSLYIALFASIFIIFQSSNSIRSKSKNLDNKIENWTYKSFNEAERIAKIVNQKLNN